jgi:hypothetical protein
MTGEAHRRKEWVAGVARDKQQTGKEEDFSQMRKISGVCKSVSIFATI